MNGLIERAESLWSKGSWSVRGLIHPS